MFGPYSSIAELQRVLERKELSAVELAHEYLRRLDTLGRAHNAVAELTEERALAQAKAADARRAGGARGPLLGIPFGVKDLLATKGIPTRWGSPGHADQVFDYDATAVARLQEAGGVLVAKLSMVELAGGGNYMVADASASGAGVCAWDSTRWAGGSSTGSGAATALGCVAYSLGSETSGSITCPSAFNGVTGFRPTYGRVSRHGAMALCWTLDKIGPLARSAEDCGLVMQTLAGHDPQDPSTLHDRLSLSTRGPRPRIGLLKEAFESNEIWETCDCVFTPVFYHAAVPLDVGFEKSFAKMGGDGGPANLLGWPSMAFPISFEEGAPLGGQIIAPAMRENVCYRVARDFQRATDWHQQRPPEAGPSKENKPA